MGATVIDGNALAEELSEHVHQELEQLKISGSVPGLATILVGEDDAAAAYERHVRRLAERLGCEYANEHLPAEAELADVLAVVGKLNADPRHRDPRAPAAARGHLRAARVPGAGPLQGRRGRAPGERRACWRRAARGSCPRRRRRASTSWTRTSRSTGRDPQTAYAGMTLVVVGRSDSVGKPAASLGLQRNATVVTCHSRTADLGSFTRQADILIVAAGVAGLVTGEMVRDGVIAVDVGIDPVKDPETGKVRFVGDIDFESVAERKAEAITPGARRRRPDHRRLADRQRGERRRGRAPRGTALRRHDVSAAAHGP